MARVPQITSLDQLSETDRRVGDQVIEVFGRIRGPFSILLHSPELAERLLPMVPFNREMSVIEGPLRCTGILAAVRETGAKYVWAAQVDAARRAGLRDAAIDILRAKGDLDGLTEDEREVAVYARQLAKTDHADQASFDALHKKHGTKWLVELTTFIGFYRALAGVTNAFEVGTPDGGDVI